MSEDGLFSQPHSQVKLPPAVPEKSEPAGRHGDIAAGSEMLQKISEARAGAARLHRRAYTGTVSVAV
ncbi:hypothetical protein [Streptomyces sp. NPDC058694]|uniref:hypothetical protein n=1 Tax=Streptomyces sp. NPDC058694 TaxID=3346603 RepID=UPI00366A3C3D